VKDCNCLSSASGLFDCCDVVTAEKMYKNNVYFKKMEAENTTNLGIPSLSKKATVDRIKKFL
jgi:hypothetical protein